MNFIRIIDHLSSANPVVINLLKQAESYQMARTFILSYIDELSRLLQLTHSKTRSLEWSLQISCLNAFREIVSMRSQRLTKYNCLKQLWLLVQRKFSQLSKDISEAFFEDIRHILLGMAGRSGIYENLQMPEFIRLQGREAARSRSKELDLYAKRTIRYIKRYPADLDGKIIKRRQRNRDRILAVFQADVDDWHDYRWQLGHLIRNSEQLRRLVKLTKEEIMAIDLAKEHHLPFGITPYYVSLMDEEPHRKYDHAVRAQVIPPLHYVQQVIATRDHPSQDLDFMRERDTSPIDLVTRRYPHIAILKPYNTCSQICVYCQRNWEIDDVLMPEAAASKRKIEDAVGWLKKHPSLTEILVTGGDPVVMPDDRLMFVLDQVSSIKHVERIRIGTRTPVVLPQRITDELVELIAYYHQPGKREVAIVTHFEHPYEVTPESMAAVQKFRRKGISVYNQAVYTVENSRRFELVALRRILRLIGVDSYYTFNTKGKKETDNYRVPIARLQQEAKEEARLMPGLVRTDEPVYNVPRLGKNYLRAVQHHTLLTILPDGSRVYEFHPWEKNLALAQTYIDVDVPIYNYLQELKRRGERIEDYKSIWYYF